MFEEYQKIYSKGKLTVHLKSTKVLLLLHQWYITSVFAVIVVQSRVRATALAQGQRAKRRGSSPSEAPLR